jgi:hypothetical protein
MDRRAVELMDRFATRTGLVGDEPQRRYLWTDAFAVCNFVGLARTTGEPRFLDRARGLVGLVHQVLGRYRANDTRKGWISGLSEEDGTAHPTLGGLRIGKPLPERPIDQPFDERLEWERDGQYFHYLTKWMHALHRLGRATDESRFLRWARELGDAAHRTFVHRNGGKRVYWKMSIDLSRPLVTSMGQHDALDGYVTYRELAETISPGPDLQDAMFDFASMIDRRGLRTSDALGVGGLLVDAYRVIRGGFDPVLGSVLMEAGLAGLRAFSAYGGARAEHRLAFRELGLALGLQAVERLPPSLSQAFAPYQRLRGDLVEHWWGHRERRDWAEHRDINDVMLATCFAPDGFLG